MAVKAITIGEEQQPMVNHVYPPNYLDYVEPDYREFSQPKAYEGKYTTGFTHHFAVNNQITNTGY